MKPGASKEVSLFNFMGFEEVMPAHADQGAIGYEPAMNGFGNAIADFFVEQPPVSGAKGN
jgi:hypothetical protein